MEKISVAIEPLLEEFSTLPDHLKESFLLEVLYQDMFSLDKLTKRYTESLKWQMEEFRANLTDSTAAIALSWKSISSKRSKIQLAEFIIKTKVLRGTPIHTECETYLKEATS